ncbi:hypothetical protein ACFE04_001174 [Oxalis oulophora]
MAPSKLKQAIGAVKDQTSIGLAKVGSSASLSDLEVAIVKATSHEEFPAEERHIREILSLTSYSRAYISACVSFIARRLNKTRNSTVALKTLMLIQRLIQEGDPAYEQEIFFSTRRGTRLLNMSDFRDASKSNAWDYSAFVRTYALYLDERLEVRMQGKRGKRSAATFAYDEDEEKEKEKERQTSGSPKAAKSTPVHEMKIDHLFSRTQHLQQLLERFLACRPTGSAKHNRVVIVALYPIVKESFQMYYDITEILGILIDRFMELEIQDSVKVYEIFCRISKQYDELDAFYGWCKTVGIARSSDYPEVEKITQKKLDLMDNFIHDKSALIHSKKSRSLESEPKEPEIVEEEDINAIKALPPPEEIPVIEEIEEEEEVKEEPKKEEEDTTKEADLLNLGEDAVSSEQHADSLALALFDGGAPAGPNPPPAWEAFKDDNGDWETALVQYSSSLSVQRTQLGGGFDSLLLDGMYQHGSNMAAMASTGYGGTGSASSVALGSAGRPAMLALPAPPAADGRSTVPGADPFAASVMVAPPSYVQMTEIEKKQRLLVEEQLMWQQYRNNGMQGHMGFSQNPQYPYNNMGGGYIQRF